MKILMVIAMVFLGVHGTVVSAKDYFPLKAIHNGGDVIDCVDIYKQPSLQHPLLKDHVIQMRPASYPEGFERHRRSSEGISPELQKNEICPEGSIPITRRRVINRVTHPAVSGHGSKILDDAGIPHEYAVLKPDKPSDYGYFGAAARINVWDPFVEVPQEYSMGRIALAAEGDMGVEAIFVGAQVYPRLYGDNQLRLFMNWKVSTSPSTCYVHCNTDCKFDHFEVAIPELT